MTDQSGLDFIVEGLRARFAPAGAEVPGAEPAVIEGAVGVAAANKVLSFLAPALRGDVMAEKLNAYKYAMISASSRILSETIAISALFGQKNIRHVVIKGPLWQHDVYGDFFVRPAADIDILVDRQDVARANATLLADGYRLRTASIWWSAFLGEQSLVKAGPPRLAVDLHHRLTQPGVPLLAPAKTWLAAAGTTAYRGVLIPVPSRSDAMLLNLISLAKALYNREPAGSYICDLYAILMAGLPGAADSFVALAAERRLEGVARVGLRAMAAVFDSDPGPDPALGRGLSGLSRRDWQALIFTPRAPNAKWPKRRDFVWAYCAQEPVRYAREIGWVMASELARRLFERGPAAGLDAAG
jgi:hypothetical protein